MVTIKEVAKLAGVSIGTVSNVMNGKTKNKDLIERVESAVARLGYKPDAAARSLIHSSTRLIGVILPDARLSEYGALLSELEYIFGQQGYQLFVQFSYNNKIRERNCLERCQERKASGCILFTELYQDLEKKDCGEVPLLLITRHGQGRYGGDRVVLDYSQSFQQAVSYYKEEKKESSLGLVLGRDIFCEKSIAQSYLSAFQDPELIQLIDYKKETAFRVAFRMLSINQELTSFIAGNYEQAQGVIKALTTLGRRDYSVTVVKESGWMEDYDTFEAQLSVSMGQVAQKAAARLLEAIESPGVHECLTERLTAKFERTRFVFEDTGRSYETLRFLMLDCPAGKSLQMLADIYENKTGIQIHFDFTDYDSLEQYLNALPETRERTYDGFMTDVAWLEELGSARCLADWNVLLEKEPEYFKVFLPGTVEQYGRYESDLIALPFMSGCQFLFYQEDLFTSPAYRLSFDRAYGRELTVPKTWKELNQVAEFFTASCNPKSPVPYGIRMVNGENVYLAISFLSCLMSYGSRAVDENGEVVINNDNSVKALKGFLATYQYTSKKSCISWEQAAEEFMTGSYAMIITYDSHATELNDMTKSAVAGNVGAALVPGQTPVLGGWSLALNRFKQEETGKGAAHRFVKWACSGQTAMLYSLLGGTSLQKSVYQRKELNQLYPWNDLVPENYKHLKRRYEKQRDSHWGRNNYAFSQIISSEIIRAMESEISPERAIENMELELRRLQSHGL